MKWINVKDRLPEEQERITCCFNWYKSTKNHVAQGKYAYTTNVYGEQKWYFKIDTLNPDSYVVTHWQSLPPPPKANNV